MYSKAYVAVRDCSGRSLDRYEKRGTAREEREKHGSEDPPPQFNMVDPRPKPWHHVDTMFLQGGDTCHEGRRQEMG